MKPVNSLLPAILFLAVVTPLRSQEQFLDPMFGDAGRALLRIEGKGTAPLSVGRQSDGGIVVHALVFDDAGPRCLLGRFDREGVPDPTFGTTGTVIAEQLRFGKMILLDDDRILVASSTPLPSPLAVARFTADGAPDPTFGVDGLTFPLEDADGDFIPHAILRHDGRLFVVGKLVTSSSEQGIILRLNPDGTPDNSFGTNGVVTAAAFGGVEFSDFIAAAVQGDGGVVVLAHSSFFAPLPFAALLRFNADGTLDASFGTNGQRTFLAEDGTQGAIGLVGGEVILTEKGILAGCFRLSTNSLLLTRLSYQGDPDPGFGTNGRLEVRDGNNELLPVFALVVREDGRILAATSVFDVPLSGADILIRQYDADGGPDEDFGVDGRIITDVGQKDNTPSEMMLLPDGGMILVGGIESSQLNENIAFLVRYRSLEKAGGTEEIADDPDGFRTLPTGNGVELLFAFDLPQRVELKLSGLDGREVLRTMRAVEGRRLRLDVPDELSNGLYILTVTSGGARSGSAKIGIAR